MSWSRAHAREYLKGWRARNRQKCQAYAKARRIRDPLYTLKASLARNGWTLEQYEAAWAAQAGRCAVCLRQLRRGVSARELDCAHADHCHATMKPRGILCSVCNRAIGQFGDSLDIMERAVAYLRKYQ